MSAVSFKHGDLIEVRSAAEILATLDANGCIEGLPFMPEMANFCGKRLRVDARTEKICDTVNWTGSRRLFDAVMLEDLRCDGSAHAGCQAQCRYIWKEVWLRPVESNTPASPPVDPSAMKGLIERINPFMKYTVDADGKQQERWRCQATELPKATERLSTFDPRAYIREYTCGNVSFGHFACVTARAAVEEPLRKFGFFSEAHLAGPGTYKNDEAPLNLQPGELVQIKSKEEIAATLNAKGYNRGLWFDREMMAYCGGTYRVRQRVNHFISDIDGHMIDLKTDAITLDDVICTGDRVQRRWFCPRKIIPYWRECWLRRV